MKLIMNTSGDELSRNALIIWVQAINKLLISIARQKESSRCNRTAVKYRADPGKAGMAG